MIELICSLIEKTKQRDLTKHYAFALMDELLIKAGESGVPPFLGQASPKNEAIFAPLCVLLASKFDEIDLNIPSINNLLRTYNRSLRFTSFSRSASALGGRPASSSNLSSLAMTLTYEDMVRAEKESLQIMGWELLITTPL